MLRNMLVLIVQVFWCASYHVARHVARQKLYRLSLVCQN